MCGQCWGSLNQTVYRAGAGWEGGQESCLLVPGWGGGDGGRAWGGYFPRSSPQLLILGKVELANLYGLHLP